MSEPIEPTTNNPRTLTVEPGGFRLDCKPFRLFGGALHYFRVPDAYWRDRLLKLKALGCNTVETYVPWNAHEPYKGRFDFGGMLDLEKFLALAHELGLLAIVRPGPYICAEWDFGGLPWWLVAEEDAQVRCSHPGFLKHVDEWLDVLLPKLAPFQCTRGGPVIAMQIENEYGYYGNDARYLEHLRDRMRGRGIDLPLFTSDGTFQKLTIANGGIDGELRTANFGSDAAARFQTLREVQPDGPLVCMEFWVGWFDTWGGKHAHRDAEETARELDAVLDAGASVNIYMFHGGTNFGFTAGANQNETYSPFVTSYDYDALLTEWGDVTPKYEACQRVLAKHGAQVADASAIPSVPRREFGQIEFTQSCSLHDALPALSRPIEHTTPLPMEKLGAGRGYALYRTTLSKIYRGETLVIRGMHDWCHVLLNGRTLATWYRNDPMPAMPIEFDGERATLEILVANLGRSNFGHRMMERKGITQGAFVGPSRHDERAIFGWTHFSLPLQDLWGIPWEARGNAPAPSFHRATFRVDTPADTFMHLPGWKMGCAFVNGINIGRYWAVGPQRALYIPGQFLKSGENELILFECGEASGGRAELRAEPDLG